eukprot:95770-Rhodomonas_salina.1
MKFFPTLSKSAGAPWCGEVHRRVQAEVHRRVQAGGGVPCTASLPLPSPPSPPSPPCPSLPLCASGPLDTVCLSANTECVGAEGHQRRGILRFAPLPLPRSPCNPPTPAQQHRAWTRPERAGGVGTWEESDGGGEGRGCSAARPVCGSTFSLSPLRARTDTQTQRQRDRETERQRDRERAKDTTSAACNARREKRGCGGD